MEEEPRIMDAEWPAFSAAIREQMRRIGYSRSEEILQELGFPQVIDCPVDERPIVMLRFATEGR